MNEHIIPLPNFPYIGVFDALFKYLKEQLENISDDDVNIENFIDMHSYLMHKELEVYRCAQENNANFIFSTQQFFNIKNLASYFQSKIKEFDKKISIFQKLVSSYEMIVKQDTAIRREIIKNNKSKYANLSNHLDFQFPENELYIIYDYNLHYNFVFELINTNPDNEQIEVLLELLQTITNCDAKNRIILIELRNCRLATVPNAMEILKLDFRNSLNFIEKQICKFKDNENMTKKLFETYRSIIDLKVDVNKKAIQRNAELNSRNY